MEKYIINGIKNTVKAMAFIRKIHEVFSTSHTTLFNRSCLIDAQRKQKYLLSQVESMRYKNRVAKSSNNFKHCL